MTGDLPLHADDRRTRLLAFVITTLVFVGSMLALVGWAINVASKDLGSKSLQNVQTTSLLNLNASTRNQVSEIAFAFGDFTTSLFS